MFLRFYFISYTKFLSVFFFFFFVEKEEEEALDSSTLLRREIAATQQTATLKRKQPKIFLKSHKASKKIKNKNGRWNIFFFLNNT
jgi:hypothetical protein